MTFLEEKVLDDTYVMRTFARAQVEFVSGHGMILVDSEGKEYMDFLAGIGVCCLGHAHPVVAAALSEQVHKLVHVSNYFYIEHRGEVARHLSHLANRSSDRPDQLWKTFFANSGAEADECALKLARLYAKRRGSAAHTVVSLRGSFHGRTLGTLAATMQDRLQHDFMPLPAGYYAVDPNDSDQLEEVFATHGDEICAVLVEPIQGESGVHPLTGDYLRSIRQLCNHYGALMICDEVQTGTFRTGKAFAFQHTDVVPDIFTLAKGIAGGVPMGACVARAEIADTFHPGDHGSTFGGSNLALAVADSVLTELDTGHYDQRAEKVGAYLQKRLGETPHIVDVRGAGLMVGCDVDDGAPEAHDIVTRALGEGLVLNATGPHTLRLLPPLICTEQDVDCMIERLMRALG